jgi:uncharacterized membrane protein
MYMVVFKEILGVSGYLIEVAGVLVILFGCVYGTFRFLKACIQLPSEESYTEFRRNLSRSILLGLEFLIAGDIIRTVIVAATLQNISVLALIILIRTFLGITLHLEVEGRWPWQEAPGKVIK